MRAVLTLAAALTLALPLAAACKSAESKGAPATDPAPGGAAPGGDLARPVDKGPGPGGGPAAPGGDKNDSSFNLQIAPPAAGKAGAEAVAHVVVTPGSGFHVNQDYPTKLTITPPDGVKVAKAEQVKDDTVTMSADKLQFDVKLTPDKPGTYKVAGTLKFAVCTESSCDPKKRDIAFDLAAN